MTTNLLFMKGGYFEEFQLKTCYFTLLLFPTYVFMHSLMHSVRTCNVNMNEKTLN